MRAVVYARYSSDKQSDSSLADQARNCRRRAEAMNAEVVRIYEDAAISGARNDRPQYRRMLEDAVAGGFDILMVDDLSRLSRDTVESETAIRHLEFEGVRIIGVCDGYDSEMFGRKLTRGMRALVNEIYLDDLRDKVHRSLTGKALKGLSAGGLAYGYRTEQDAEGKRHVIDEEQAAVVRWIFERYAAGWSPKRIAADLNERGVPSPRGKSWAASAIAGHYGKGTGILANEQYLGRLIWNRSQWVKNPDTGKRERRERPRSEWIVHEASELRIVSDTLWQAVQNRRRKSTQSQRRPRQKFLFSGLLTCGCCNGPFSIINAGYYGCSWFRNRGPAICGQKRMAKRETLERVLLRDIKTMLLDDKLRDVYKAEVRRLLAAEAQADTTGNLQRRLLQIETRIARAVEAMLSIGTSEAMESALKKAELEKRKLEFQLRQTKPRTAPVFVDTLDGMFDDVVENLESVVGEDVDEARAALRGIVGDEIVIVPRDGALWAKIKPRLAGLHHHYGLNGSGGRI